MTERRMRVLIINTSERTGGAAVAAGRLCDALNANGIEAQMMVRDAAHHDRRVIVVKHQRLMRWRFLWERLRIFIRLGLRRKHLFDIDTGYCGTDITRTEAFLQADVINLHWVNQGMLSLDDIRKILRSGKPVVWTMHDVWPATALCHLTLGCNNFTTGCHDCKYLPRPAANDLSARIWRRKQDVLSQGHITFVTCSRWLEGEARSSALLSGHDVTNIPNPIDTTVFCPADQAAARRDERLPRGKRLLLFVCQRVTNRYKGMQHLIDACRMMAREYPETIATTGVIVMGGDADAVAQQLPYEAYPIGYVTDTARIVRIYRCADVFILPSLSENLPNTIMEAMACGVPCIAFNVGGIPEEIDHRVNGYVAAYEDTADLAHGMHWLLHQADRTTLAEAAVRKVSEAYSQASVARRYADVYRHAAEQNKQRQ